MNPSDIFNRTLHRLSDAIWRLPEDPASLANWDTLAARNPIDAAISQDDEQGEIKKGAEEYRAILDECPGGVFLDLGCGYGRVAKHVLPQRRFDAYIGVDNSTVMLQAFEQRHLASPEERTTPLALIKCPIDALPLKDASVDAVFTSAVWIHNPKDIVRRSVAEVRRVLKPGGKLLVFSSFPNRSTPSHFQERIYTGLVLPLLRRSDRNGPIRLYTEQEIRALLSGFKTIEIRRVGCRILPQSVIGLPAQINLRTWKQVAMPFNRFACKALGRHASRFCIHFDVKAVK